MEEHDGLIIQSMDDIVIPTDESNLIYDTARRLYAECGRAFPGLRITQKNDIPLTRGLGSSSACIIAGLLGANTLMGGPIPQDEIIHYACVLEGHPDNVAGLSPRRWRGSASTMSNRRSTPASNLRRSSRTLS